MMVICKIKQIIPAIGLPMVKKTKKGKKIARNKRIDNPYIPFLP
jgi:hypothetical protein